MTKREPLDKPDRISRGEYPLEAAQPEDAEHDLRPLPPVPAGIDPPPPAPLQFSLGELLLVMVAAAVLLSLTTTAVRLMPGGMNPENVAGVMGLGALVCMALLAAVPSPHRLLMLGWWVLLGLYAVACLVAILLRP